MLAILSIHCSFLHYHGIDTMGLPYVEYVYCGVQAEDHQKQVSRTGVALVRIS